MKHAKKLASLLLALVMVMGLATTAFAAGETGTITIDNAVVGQTYTVYQILDLESYNVDNTTTGDGQYAYKATSAWKNFIEGNGIKDVYVNVDSQGYVTWVDGASAADFAKKAKEYADDNNITPGYYDNYNKEATFVKVEPVTATSTTIKFTGLDLGYYLVDSTMGTLCSLDTTNPDVTIKEKNVAPGNEKTVKEGDDYGKNNDAAIGDTVYFQSTITAQAGAENYVFHDKMSAGLTYGSVTGITLNGTAVDTKYYMIKTTDLEATDPCTFHVVFTQAFCDTLKANDKIVISYTATVNKDAVVGSDGNKNESWLKYGEDGDFSTTPSETKTYTWDVDVFKYTKEGETEKPLAGARFTLSKKADGTDPIALINNGNNAYRVAKADETSTVTEITTDDTGKFTIKGLDSGTYYLTETYTPAGYNKLSGAITIVVGNDGSTTVNNVKVDEVKVLNQTGSELPSTGGMGTTIFYVLGGILVVVAAVLLITKKRMNAGK